MNKGTIQRVIVILFLVFNMNVFLVPAASAQSLTEPLVPDACTDDKLGGDSECGVEEIIQAGINIAMWILAIIGAVSLAYFVYGGFVLLTAAGNSGRVDQGRKILAGTVIGLIIVLGSFTFVRFIGTLFGGGSTPANFDNYLDNTAASDNRICSGRSDGSRCVQNNQNVYACIGGGCSNISLCEYWSARQPNQYNIGPGQECVPQADCVSGTEIAGYCPGATAAEGICCLRQ